LIDYFRVQFNQVVQKLLHDGNNRPTNRRIFSLRRGPFNRALEGLHLHNKQGKVALGFVTITWVPLIIITAIERTLYSGTQTALSEDVAMQARVLVGDTMVIIIKSLSIARFSP